MHRTIAAIGATLCASGCYASADTRPFEIVAYAPPHTMMIVDIPSADRLVEAARRTGLMEPFAGGGAWWDLRVGPEEDAPTFEQLLDRLEVDPEDLGLPTGAVGLVVFYPEAPDPELDEEEAEELQPLVYADFGARAKAAADLLEAVIDEAERAELIRLADEDEVDGVKIVAFESLEWTRRLERRDLAIQERRERIRAHRERADGSPAPADLWSFDFDLSEPTGDPLIDMLAEVFGGMEAGAYAFRDGTLYLAIDGEAIAQTLLLRRGGGPSAIESDSMAEAISLATQQPGGHIAMAVDMRLVGRAADAASARNRRMYEGYGWEPDPFSMIYERVLGLRHLRALGASVVLGEADQIAEVRAEMTMDERPLLLRLFPERSAAWSPPTFVPADAQSAMRILVDFKGVIPMIQEQINALPEEQRQEAAPAFAAASLIAQQVLDALGSELTIVTTAEQTVEDAEGPGFGFFLAVACNDETVITNLLSSFGPTLGMTAAEFEGSQLYHPEFGPSIGVGFDHVFLGTRTAVEDSMRRAAMPRGVPGLQDQESYRRVSTRVGSEGTAVGYFSESDSGAMEEESIRDALHSINMPEAWAPRVREALKKIGPSAFEVRVSDERVVLSSILLRQD